MMPTSRTGIFSAIILVISLCATMAFADDGADELAGDDVDDETIERVQEAFDQGATYYFEEEYGRAIVEFRRAHEMLPNPVFLFNIALCQREMGRPGRAYDAAVEAQEMFDDFQARGENVPVDLRTRNDALVVSLESVAITHGMVEELADEPVEIADGPDVEPADSSFGVLGWAGVGALTVGLGALTGAAVIDRQVANGIEELRTDTSLTEAQFDDRRDSLAGQQTSGKVFLFSGAALATAGISLIVFELMSGGDSSSGVAISPSVTRPGIDVVVRW